MKAARVLMHPAKHASRKKEALQIISASFHHAELFSTRAVAPDSGTKHTCQFLQRGSIFKEALHSLKTRFERLRVILERDSICSGALLPKHPKAPGGARGFASAATGDSDDPVEEFNKEMSAVFGESAARDQFSQTPGASPLSRPTMRETPPTSESHGEDSSRRLTHVDSSGRASMVDVSQKRDSIRKAVASAQVSLGRAAFSLVRENKISKGDVLTVAQIAGINAAKQTANLIPLCHNLLLSKVKVELTLDDETQSVRVRAEVKTRGPTGVEMEALTAASVASLTVYDMCKAVSKSIVISNVLLESKSGGKSGDWSRPQD